MRKILIAIIFCAALSSLMATTIYTPPPTTPTTSPPVKNATLTYTCNSANAWAIGPTSGDFSGRWRVLHAGLHIISHSSGFAHKGHLGNREPDRRDHFDHRWQAGSHSGNLGQTPVSQRRRRSSLFFSVLHPSLQAGTKYWVVVTDQWDLDVNWFVASDLFQSGGMDVFLGSWSSAGNSATKEAAGGSAGDAGDSSSPRPVRWRRWVSL